ncbi:mannose-1-phosphate guanylyltransferase [Pedobacter sp. KR3-3]|uniref:Mannose-1-phosphate guanylyltransferase n=1 Tax=Pedobacter albus TaxID=3113905 RepID=A0ABU7IBK5_9SPHI|nr:mannose-1-phosphate guanylyltransferase [Pedobacter sp. KR3-3]MEE1946857.1 mannose-1-phosphate guanylyltransferase [Pedobacter sp. KR3-3]
MAGGVGSRFWPKSRNNFPKQFIDILGIGKSLLQLTYERFLKVCPEENIYFLTNEIYTDLIKEQLNGVSDKNIISEPCRRNTAPCIAYAAFKIKDLNPNANLVVAPSDHLILKEDVFISKIEKALAFAEHNDALVTLGIEPTRPDTGYGYIKYLKSSATEIFKVEQFLEKPTLEKAKAFLATNEYVWNAGIFIWNVNALLSGFKNFAIELYSVFERGERLYNTDDEYVFIKENYPKCENISIDFALMEKAENVYTLPGDFGWSDLGTWASLHEVMSKDASNNSFGGKAAFLQDTENCLIQIPKEKIAVIKGLANYIVVDDGEVLMIYPKNLEQEVKNVSASVADSLGEYYQ